MTPPPREALQGLTGIVEDSNGETYVVLMMDETVDKVLTALAPFLIPEGCVLACGFCGWKLTDEGACGGLSHPSIDRNCPLRKATP